jgi:hypothetical protein
MGDAPPLERWEASPPSPRAAEAAEETAPGAGAGAPAAGHPTREATHRGGAGARRGNGWGRGGGYAGGGCSASQAPEEEEMRVFHPEVGDCFPLAASFRSVRA